MSVSPQIKTAPKNVNLAQVQEKIDNAEKTLAKAKCVQNCRSIPETLCKLGWGLVAVGVLVAGGAASAIAGMQAIRSNNNCEGVDDWFEGLDWLHSGVRNTTHWACERTLNPPGSIPSCSSKQNSKDVAGLFYDQQNLCRNSSGTKEIKTEKGKQYDKYVDDLAKFHEEYDIYHREPEAIQKAQAKNNRAKNAIKEKIQAIQADNIGYSADPKSADSLTDAEKTDATNHLTSNKLLLSKDEAGPLTLCISSATETCSNNEYAIKTQITKPLSSDTSLHQNSWSKSRLSDIEHAIEELQKIGTLIAEEATDLDNAKEVISKLVKHLKKNDIFRKHLINGLFDDFISGLTTRFVNNFKGIDLKSNVLPVAPAPFYFDETDISVLPEIPLEESQSIPHTLIAGVMAGAAALGFSFGLAKSRVGKHAPEWYRFNADDQQTIDRLIQESKTPQKIRFSKKGGK